ncbi:hypothetical protein MTR67_008477 [Solanum verrucosum]|uniref:Uncharacterized protein n=1 Tax=Solanum verrucosum TaxID=315347 RepID=A0AAF0Q279_SOLVR|nr:hypothetical protein MTR67_008477 [Solanum verrucosum]
MFAVGSNIRKIMLPTCSKMLVSSSFKCWIGSMTKRGKQVWQSKVYFDENGTYTSCLCVGHGLGSVALNYVAPERTASGGIGYLEAGKASRLAKSWGGTMPRGTRWVGWGASRQGRAGRKPRDTIPQGREGQRAGLEARAGWGASCLGTGRGASRHVACFGAGREALEARCMPRGRAGGPRGIMCVVRSRVGGLEEHTVPRGGARVPCLEAWFMRRGGGSWGRAGASRYCVCLGAGRDWAPRASWRGGAGRAHLGVWSCVGPRGTVPQGSVGCLEAQCGPPALP